MTENNKKSKKKELPPKRSKEDRLFDNILKITQQFMSGKSYVAMNESELFERLRLVPQHREIFGRVLDELHRLHVVNITKNRYSLKTSTNEIVTGVIRVHPRGFGFLQAEDSSKFPDDIFIPKHLIQNSVDGDSVEVLDRSYKFFRKRP